MFLMLILKHVGNNVDATTPQLSSTHQKKILTALKVCGPNKY